MTRKIIKRVLMGPPDYFTQQKLDDDLHAYQELSLWGLVLRIDDPIDPLQFLQQLHPDGDPSSKVHIGRLQSGVSDNLCSPSAWIDPKVLSFGSEETKAHV